MKKIIRILIKDRYIYIYIYATLLKYINGDIYEGHKVRYEATIP